ncbi:MAG: ABC transporter permease [Acidimicrobiia bacterium]|nr:ABC transporter permease [Acidimicrobiia bacterium]
MNAFLAIVRVTIKQTLRLRRALGLLLLSGSVAGMYLLFMIATRNSTNTLALQREEAIEVSIGMTIGVFMNIVVPVVTLIIATSVMGDERRDNTMSFLVLRPIRRVVIAGAKVTAAFLEALVLTGIGAAAFGILVGIKIETFSYFVPLLVGTTIATAAYAAIFVPLGYLLKRATLIGLTYVFIWENGIAAAVPALSSLSPWRIGASAIAGLAPPEFQELVGSEFGLGAIDPGAGGAVIKAVVLMAVCSAIMASILRRRDLAT